MTAFWQRQGGVGIYLWAIVVFAVSEALCRALGIRFAHETLGSMYQYLDPEILRHDLWRGLMDLHAQPPLFNLFLGSVLKAFPDAYPFVFSLLFGGMALGLLLSMAWLMQAFSVPSRVNGTLILLFALSPNFLVYRDWLFYTLPVALALSLSAVVLILAVRGRSPRLVAAFFALISTVMWTRSVYHPLWLLLVVALLCGISAPLRRPVLWSGAAAFVLMNLLFLKNFVVADSYAASSWLGLSLTKRWPLSQSEMRDLRRTGQIPPFWQRRPFQEPDALRELGFFAEVEPTRPALESPYKSNGEPNFNHRDYVTISRDLLEGDWVVLRAYPQRYLQRTVTALSLFLQPGPNSVHFLVDYDFSAVHAYRDFLTRYLYWGGQVERPIRMLDPPFNLWFLGFPVLLWVALRRALGSRDPPTRAAFGYMLLTVVWVTAVTSAIEIGENDRMRWEVEPFLVVFLVGFIQDVWARFRQRLAK